MKEGAHVGDGWPAGRGPRRKRSRGRHGMPMPAGEQAERRVVTKEGTKVVRTSQGAGDDDESIFDTPDNSRPAIACPSTAVSPLFPGGRAGRGRRRAHTGPGQAQGRRPRKARAGTAVVFGKTWHGVKYRTCSSEPLLRPPAPWTPQLSLSLSVFLFLFLLRFQRAFGTRRSPLF